MVCIYNLMINGYICVLLAAPAAAAAAAKLYSVQGILYWNTNYQQSPILSQAICVMPQIDWHLAIPVYTCKHDFVIVDGYKPR